MKRVEEDDRVVLAFECEILNVTHEEPWRVDIARLS
jgi:hypothetical protein